MAEIGLGGTLLLVSATRLRHGMTLNPIFLSDSSEILDPPYCLLHHEESNVRLGLGDMDPLSVTASIVSIIAVLQAVGSGLQKINSLRGVPDVVLALNNEVSDLQVILQEADKILLDQGQLTTIGKQWCLESNTGLASLLSSVDRAKGKLEQLQNLLEKRLGKSRNKADRLRIWLLEEGNVVRMQKELRGSKLDIGNALAIMNS